MIDRGHRKTSFLFGASGLAALLTCAAAWGNGDHPMRLPPPDPGPALAQIEATPEEAPRPTLPEPPRSVIAPEAGHAIFSPFSSSEETTPPAPVVRAAASNGSDMTATVLGLLICVAAGGYLWHRARHAS
jgi:hypothetical protein